MKIKFLDLQENKFGEKSQFYAELSLKNAFVPKILNEKTIFLNLTNIKILLILSMELFKVSFNNK